MLYCYMDSPVGCLFIAEEDGAIVRVEFDKDPPPGARMAQSALLAECMKQLTEYFAGNRREFDLPVKLRGTPFQMACWEALREIPYGETRSYADIARRIGKPKACRAVGGANHVNPVSIIVPCHRVIGASGKLVGYGGGLNTNGLSVKEYLLALERGSM